MRWVALFGARAGRVAVEQINSVGTERDELSDFEKIRRIPYLFAFNILTAAALLCTVTSPLALFAAELGVPKDRIGLIGGIMPFVQVIAVIFLPIVMTFGHRRVSAYASLTRYVCLSLILAAPLFAGDADMVFWTLFVAMLGFSIFRTMAETAIWPWSQEYMPTFIRGRLTGSIALAYLPVALVGSVLVQLWLDGHEGIERFYPVFVFGLLLGVVAALSLFGLGGGRPRPGAVRGLDSIRAMRVPLGDRNFLLYLVSSGSQFLVYIVINLFILLFFSERLGISSGQIVLMAAFVPVGSAVGSVIAGWFVDRYGTRAIRITLQVLQVAMLIALMFVNADMPGTIFIVGLIFFAFGLLFPSAIGVGSIYMLNYVPPANKESYMTLAYMTDGLTAGGAAFLAGWLLEFLSGKTIVIAGASLGNFETLFALGAMIIVLSAITFALLREEGATGVRDFLGQFGRGSPLRALWGIHRYAALTSEERRRELTYGFGEAGSALAKEELIAALSDPSFDVRYEAIQSLGHLPPSPTVVRALERMLAYDGLVELQYAALNSLGRIRAVGSGEAIARFLDDPNAILRARAVRALGDIRDQRYLPRIRQMLADDPETDCRLAAVSALGKFRDEESIDGLLQIYRELVNDAGSAIGEPRSKVVLLALAKILDCEESFSREWRREEKVLGHRLPGLFSRLSDSLRKRSGEEHSRLLMRAAAALSSASTREAFSALQATRPFVAASGHPEAAIVLKLMDGTRDIELPHRALLILLALSMRPVLVQSRFDERQARSAG